MSAASSTTRVVSESGSDVGPGERLREAREDARLTVGEVASRLRLAASVVERLEADDYERLHGTTFVRGYLRGYARLLDLPEGPILEAYERHAHGPPALVSELGHKPEVHVSDFPVRMVTYVIAGLLVVLVVLWWQSRQLGTDAETASTALGEDAVPAVGVADQAQAAPASTRSPGANEAEPAARTAVEVPETAQASQIDTSTSTSSEPPSAQPAEAVSGAAPAPTAGGEASAGARDESAAAAGADTASSDPAPAPQPGGESGEAATMVAVAGGSGEDRSAMAVGGEQEIGEQLAATGESETDAVAEAAPPPPAPLPGSDVLAIQLSRESWIEIYDRGGGRLFYSLAREGSEIVVEGAGPMRVLLGEVEGAVVAYNGEPYDLSRYQGRSVVSFTVGELSATPGQEAPAPSAADEPLTRELQPPAESEQGDSVVDAGAALDTLDGQAAAAASESAAEASAPEPAATGTAPLASGARQPDS